jgi:hypothetical protein
MKMSFNITCVTRHRQRRHTTRLCTAVAEREVEVKTTCCKSYQRKGKACKTCPVMAHLDPKALKQGRKHKK